MACCRRGAAWKPGASCKAPTTWRRGPCTPKKVRPAEALRYELELYTYQFLMCDVDDSSRVYNVSTGRRAQAGAQRGRCGDLALTRIAKPRVDVYHPLPTRRPPLRVAPPARETAPDQNTWLTQAMTRVLESRESVPALALPHLSGRCQALVQGTCRLHPLRTRLPAAVMYTSPRDTGYGKQFQGPQQQQQEEGNQTYQSIRTFWRHARFRRMRNHRAP